ncbi:MAG: penicillin-binding protein [Erysipelotrichaceae bacterium]|nr:penicillin-binding protein [Erysipelotrichaceae bacterium]
MSINRKKNSLSTITDVLFSLVLVAITISTIYLSKAIINTPSLSIETINKKKSSKIYDNQNNFVKQLTMEDYENVKYEDLPDVFINALLSCEDVRYFMHEGIDLPRILSALKNDVFSLSLKEGASTLTQQLIKNMLLSNTKTIERKIQEVYLANKIEKLYSKKDILEFYCNYVCFDGVNHGVSSASYAFFNKSVSKLTLPEAALLAGVVNAPSAYSPFLNKDKAFLRKNVVLHLMKKHGYISEAQEIEASKITIDELLKEREKTNNNNVNANQAYIDIVYRQILKKTGYDPYTMPMEIYTYMDSALQTQIDKMQDGSSPYLSFDNDLQQFASTIIDNQNGAIIACFGGRNYKGAKLFNHAYDKLIQPASTIKVVLDYALAFEYLHYDSMQILKDVPCYYPNSDYLISNVDNLYLGEVTIADAIGYSRNTTAISTLKEVISKISLNKVINYMKEINIMDDGEFSYSYGLGGYTYGLSLTNLAAAYSMLARSGLYIEPLSVKYIKLLDGSNKEIHFTPYQKQVLSPSTCYLISDVLKQVMDNNYWSIKDCKPSNVNVYAKTGTTSFDSKMKEEYGYEKNASKDRLLASYTKDYTITAWTGFDEYIKNGNTYFKKSSPQANVVKTFTKTIYEKIAKKNQYFTKPDDIVEVNIVKGSDLLPTMQVSSDYIVKSLYKKEDVPKEFFKEPFIEEKVLFDYFILDDSINFIFFKEEKEISYPVIFDYEKILNGKGIYIDIYENDRFIETIECEQITSFMLNKARYHLDIYYKYKNGYLKGSISSLDFTYI